MLPGMRRAARTGTIAPVSTTTPPDIVVQRINGAARAVASLRGQSEVIAAAATAITQCLIRGGTVYTCGNGGSAAEALHLAEELIGRYRSNRPALRGICLNADPTALTCIANDFGFDAIFARQCETLLTPRDVLVVFSTSGRSANLIHALETARAKGAMTIGLLGRGGGPCAPLCAHAIVVDDQDSGHIQEAHQVVLHIFCEYVEGECMAGPNDG